MSTQNRRALLQKDAEEQAQRQGSVCRQGSAVNPASRRLAAGCLPDRGALLSVTFHEPCRYTVTPTVSVLAVMKARLAGATKGEHGCSRPTPLEALYSICASVLRHAIPAFCMRCCREGILQGNRFFFEGMVCWGALL
jgi:hypothetical protein